MNLFFYIKFKCVNSKIKCRIKNLEFDFRLTKYHYKFRECLGGEAHICSYSPQKQNLLIYDTVVKKCHNKLFIKYSRYLTFK